MRQYSMQRFVVDVYDGLLGRELLRELSPAVAVVVWARERLRARVDEVLDLLHARDGTAAAAEAHVLQFLPVVVVQDG